MDTLKFESLVFRAVEDLPAEFRERLENVDIIVADRPTREQRRVLKEEGHTLLGLYEGVPLTSRGGHYDWVVPDKITIFQRAIESVCRTEADIVREVRRVVIHELAHHFGIDDDRLEELGY